MEHQTAGKLVLLLIPHMCFAVRSQNSLGFLFLSNTNLQAEQNKKLWSCNPGLFSLCFLYLLSNLWQRRVVAVFVSTEAHTTSPAVPESIYNKVADIWKPRQWPPKEVHWLRLVQRQAWNCPCYLGSRKHLCISVCPNWSVREFKLIFEFGHVVLSPYCWWTGRASHSVIVAVALDLPL